MRERSITQYLMVIARMDSQYKEADYNQKTQLTESTSKLGEQIGILSARQGGSLLVSSFQDFSEIDFES